MLLIPCPFCGPRDETEFHYAGEPKPRPGPAEQVDDATWGAYLFDKRNEKGPHEELWHHLGGCRRHFVMTRDTVTHRILATRAPGAHGAGEAQGEVQP
jgi:heterotetrameric sarcosine oxidase delta subunit